MRIESSSPQRLTCRTSAHMAEAEEFMASCALMATDIETIPHKKLSKAQKRAGKIDPPWVMTVVSYSGVTDDNEMRSYAFQLTSEKSSTAEPPANLQQVLESVRRINDNPVRKTLHNGVYDAAWFLRYQMPMRNYAYDSMTMWWAKYPALPKTLDFVSSVLLDDHAYWKMGRKDNDFTTHTVYAMQDTEATLRNTIRLLHWMRDDPSMRRNFLFAHMRCLVGLEMSMKGMLVDFDMRAEMEKELEAESERVLAEFRYLVDDPNANPNSPKQMAELFYSILGATPRNATGREIKRVTEKNQPSTGRIALRAVEAEHVLLRRIVASYNRAKEPAKQISNVIGIEFPDSRFRTSYHGSGTTTSRFSSSSDAFGFGGNAQNIRKKYRRIIRADHGCFLLELDFSAADDVFVSYESEEPKKIALIESGKDVHAYNAAEVFFTDWTYEQIGIGKNTKDPAVVHPITGIRQITKKVTHGANYLMAGLTLLMSAGRDAIVAAAKALGHGDAGSWPTARLVDFCEMLDRRYRLFYPRFARSGTHSFYLELQSDLLRSGSYTSCFGYTQRFTNDPHDQGTLRACAASVGQANTAGRVNMAMDELVHGVRLVRFRDGEAPDKEDSARRVSEATHGCSLRLQTHDSLTFNVDPTHSHWREGVANIFHVMRRPVLSKGRIVRVGIEADCSIWWGKDSHEVSGVADVESWLESQKEHLFREAASA